jgi:superfamily I DNA/RNA helicase
VGGQGSAAEVMDFEEPGIRVVNYASAKGLEFDTVFLPELQLLTEDHTAPAFKMRFFVMTSRARDELYLMYSGEGDPALLNAFPRNLIGWP